MATTIPSAMRAVQWRSAAGGFEKNLRLTTNASLPKSAHSLPKDSVLVKVHYTSVNPVDYKLPESPLGYLFSKPATPGLDYAGVAVRSNVSHVQPGTRIFGALPPPTFGTLAEYIVVKKAQVALAPEDVKLEDLGALGVTALTAYQTIAPFVKPGDEILINGASGGVGTFAIQIGKALGCKVTAVCSGANAQLCKDLGADAVIDYKTTNLVDYLKKSGKQYDLVTDNIFNNPSLYWQSHHFLKKNKNFITIAGDPSLGLIQTMLAIFLTPSWLGGGQRPFRFVGLNVNGPELEKIAAWIKEGKVKPVVDQILDLDQSAKAYERLKTGRTRGNILIKVAQ